jgi:alkylated DNA repair dioxygenase AlkB
VSNDATERHRLESGQLGLFDGENVSIDESFSTARRTTLDSTSWVEHVPNWLSGSRQVFSELLDASGWAQRDRWMFDQAVIEPRLTAEFPDLGDAPPILRKVAATLSNHYSVEYTAAWLNLYRDNHDSTSWHGDTGARRRPHAIVPVLSLGAPRKFLLRPRGGGRSTPVTPSGGDLIVMGGRCQRDWQHCVPKQARPLGARISVNLQSRESAPRSRRPSRPVADW